MKQLIVYHGSNNKIEKPIFGFGNPRNDYGLGFYCTQDIDIGKEYSASENIDGYANKYSLDTTSLSILDLSSSKYNILNWITILLENRVFSLKNDITKAGKEYLIENFSIPYKDYDIIKGYRADDSYFAFAESFLNNTISCQRLAQALKLGNLGEQIVLKSKKAFEQLEYIDSILAPSNIYYKKRTQRSDLARFEFLSNKQGTVNKDSIYLADLIRGNISPDDPRLQWFLFRTNSR